MKFLSKNYIYLAGLIIFCVYLSTIAPTIVEGDSGELATVQYTLGIAHPTGYPLFAIIGYLFSLIPLPFTPIFQLNLLCAIWTTLAAVVFIKTAELILVNLSEFQNKSITDNKVFSLIKELNTEGISELIKIFIIISSGFILAFSRTFWFQSTSVEVYSLHLFLLNMTIYYLLKAFIEREVTKLIFSKNWLLFLVFFSLGLSNHRTILYILPSAAYIYYYKYKINFAAVKRLFIMFLIPVCLTFIIYLYLPIRASQKPLLNWEAPNTIGGFLRSINGTYYHSFISLKPVSILESIENYVSGMKINLWMNNSNISEFSFASIFFYLGVFVVLLRYRRLFIFYFVFFMATIYASSLYRIPDIDPYFLGSYISLAIFSLFGIIFLFSIYKKYPANIFIVVLIILCILGEFSFNYHSTTQRENYFMRDYITSMLNSADENAVIISQRGCVLPSYYVQHVEGVRRDVVFVSNPLFQFKWYNEQLKHIYPGAIFDNKTGYKVNVKNRTFYVTPDMIPYIQKKEFIINPKAKIIPDIFLYRIVETDSYVPAPNPDFQIRNFNSEKTVLSVKEKIFRDAVLIVLIKRIYYEINFKKYDRAQIYIKKLLELCPNAVLPKEFNMLLMKNNKNSKSF